jgi:nitroimidazol reductase NimA-like FMN-containing flavoprotein (pyridoxamine 5'-phosphate oxidase superfamily)
MRELSEPECRELLAGKNIGRVAFCSATGPVVLPVNYRLSGDAVVFRTAAHNSIAQNLNGRTAAFQVDEVDDFTQSGWSVLVQGTGGFVESARELSEEERPTPWPEGSRTLFVRIPLETVTGRQLYPS